MRPKEKPLYARAQLWAAKHPLATIGIFILLTLGPFLNKAVHIDDPVFVWTAEQILKHPGDCYGFDVNWTGHTVPMSVENCNPPTTSYFLAGVMAVFGEQEFVLHGAMLLVAAIIGGVFYKVGLDSATIAADRRRESILLQLSRSDGPLSVT